MATELGMSPKDHKLPGLYRAFAEEIRTRGVVSEARVMARYGMHHPVDMAKKIQLGMALFAKGRIDLAPRQVKNCINTRMNLHIHHE
jgi:hypothetical protein